MSLRRECVQILGRKAEDPQCQAHPQLWRRARPGHKRISRSIGCSVQAHSDKPKAYAANSSTGAIVAKAKKEVRRKRHEIRNNQEVEFPINRWGPASQRRPIGKIVGGI